MGTVWFENEFQRKALSNSNDFKGIQAVIKDLEPNFEDLYIKLKDERFKVHVKQSNENLTKLRNITHAIEDLVND